MNLIDKKEEFIEIVRTTLDSLLQICDKTTSGNVSHNIANIKSGLFFYKKLLEEIS